MSIAIEVLSFIRWVEGLQKPRFWFTEGGRSWLDEGKNAPVMKPGEIEPTSEIDQYLPEYVGLLDAQLYWPGLLPGKFI